MKGELTLRELRLLAQALYYAESWQSTLADSYRGQYDAHVPREMRGAARRALAAERRFARLRERIFFLIEQRSARPAPKIAQHRKTN